MSDLERDPTINKGKKPFQFDPAAPDCSMMPGELVSVMPVETDHRSMMPGELEPSRPQEADITKVLPQDQQPGA